MTFKQCPRCGNNEKGFTIYQCKSCSGMWCFKSTFLSSDGCGTGNKCPNCQKELEVNWLSADSFKNVGYTE